MSSSEDRGTVLSSSFNEKKDMRGFGRKLLISVISGKADSERRKHTKGVMPPLCVTAEGFLF